MLKMIHLAAKKTKKPIRMQGSPVISISKQSGQNEVNYT